MEFWKTIVRLARRRFIGPPIVALAVVAGVAGFIVVPANYTADVVLLLTGPGNPQPVPGQPATATGGRTNPLLMDNGGLRTTAAALILATGTPEVLAELGAPKEGPNKLTIDDGSSKPALLGTGGPFLAITAESPSAQGARDLVLRAHKRLQDELLGKQRQLQAPEALYISMVNVTPPSTPEADNGARIQAAAIALVLTVAAGLGIAYVWTRRRPEPPVPAAQEEPDEPDPWAEAVAEEEPPESREDLAAPEQPEPADQPELEPVGQAGGHPAARAGGDDSPVESVVPPSDGEPEARDEDVIGTQTFPQAVDEDATATQTFPVVEIPSPRSS